METVTKVKRNQFLKKDRPLTNVTDLLASGTIFFHFLIKQSTAASRTAFQAEAHFLASTCSSANSLFWLVKTRFLSTVNSIVLC